MKKRLKKIAKETMLFIYKIMEKLLPVQNNVVVFNSSMGRNYTGNPRYIYEYMVEKGLDKKYKCIWFFETLPQTLPGRCKIVRFKRLKYFYYMSIAKTWVFDCRQPDFLIKKKNAAYIQTWHGTPLKKLALDMDSVSMAEDKDIAVYKEKFYRNAMTWDYLIAQNDFSANIFKKAFGFEKTMLTIGYPRNDILIHKNNEKYIAALKKELSLPKDKKIILYAPTWRDNEFYSSGKYKFNPHMDFQLLKKALSDKYCIIVKYHYLVKDLVDWSLYSDFIYDFDMEYDISLLYLVSDMLITDYSSVMFDYSILKRPMLFYCYDYDNYKNNLRGFYFDFEKEAPGPISYVTEELIQDILNYDSEKYRQRYEAFTKKYNRAEHGTACKEVCSLIQKVNK